MRLRLPAARAARIVLLIALSAGALSSRAAPLSEEDVPEPLKPWIKWVLHGHESARCPFIYSAFEDKRCAWPGELHIELGRDSLDFKQEWRLYRDGFVPLPGDAGLWPQDVRLDGAAVAVSPLGDGAPRVHASAGVHALEGRIHFERAPEYLQLPQRTGLVRLMAGGEEVASPDIDEQGRLWLAADPARRDDAPAVRNTLELRVFRRVIDEVPLRVVTRIDVDVSGESREVLLGPALLEDAIPLSLQSPLPARLEPDGRLRVQVRPGRYHLTLVTRQPGRVTALTRPAAVPPWPAPEVWVFDARNALRLVRIEGVPSVEPRQTSLPEDWRSLPAFRVGLRDTFRMVVSRRGDAEPEADNLALARTLWLDFDGGGYTVNDRLSGTLSSSWRLEAEPVLDLGRVTVDGEPWFITRRIGSEHEGVELRRGALNLSADARVSPRSELPAVGWHQDFQSIRARLHLPPGWRLLAAAGIDRVEHTWISRWTLFDLFLLLIVAAVAGRLWGWRWGLAALFAIGLVFHETGAPRWVWLHIFAAVALLEVLPEGRLARGVRLYRYAALAALAIILVPFAVDQTRMALFPQLERPWQAQPTGAPAEDALLARAEPARRPQAPMELESRKSEADRVSRLATEALPGIGRLDYFADELRRIDPEASIQTGPGLPRWQWQSAELIWNGPVAKEQGLRLVLLPPAVTGLLRVLSVALLALLALRALGVRRSGGVPTGGRAAAAAVMLAVVAFGFPDVARAAEFPPPETLKELETRLLQAPDCVPECAALARMRLDVRQGGLSARLEVHAHAAVAVPLPGRLGAWLPDAVQVDGYAARGVLRGDGGTLWLALEPGVHQLTVSGRLPARDRVELALPLKPRRVEARAEGWALEGIGENGVVAEHIQLRRVRPAESRPEALEPGSLPPFVRVERTLLLGLEWRVVTRVVRVSPPGAAVVLAVPLIRGEAVTSEGVRVENDRAVVNLGPQATHAGWESVLEQRPGIGLTAPDETAWTEVWRLDASPVWHVETDGIPVIHQQQQGRRFPEWHPWPGERVSLKVSRPEGVPGNTLTIEASNLAVNPGQRASDAKLELVVRTSQGTQHPVILPAGAELASVAIDGRSQPARQQDRVVTLPLAPGVHEVTLEWRTADGISALFKTPAVDIGAPGVNASAQVQVPRSRWVLSTGGPELGPAVLFWGLLIVIVAIAAGLGRTGRTPLKTRHWLLLGLGLSQIPVYLALIVVGWLFALDARGRLRRELPKWQFNLMQSGLVLLTLAALALLFYAVKQGLLGVPEMQIGGNGSSGYHLRWFQDRAASTLPDAWVLSVPLIFYRLLMLAWALWVAFALVAWLRWSWESFATGGYWRSIVLGRPKRAGTPSSDARTP